MNKEDVCAASDRGAECGDVPAVATPVPLCRRHLASVMHQATRIFIIHEASEQIQGTYDADAIGRAKVLEISLHLSGRHRDAVYFISNGSRIKIGYTTNLRERISALSLRREDVVLLLSGGMDLERALHRRFKHARVNNTEWFAITRQLRDFIARVAPLTLPSLGVPGADPMDGMRYPDGRVVGRDEWPHLWQAFIAMRRATKADLVAAGVVASRDTVRRALDVWTQHGVLVRKEGRTELFYLPKTTNSEEGTA